VILAGLDHPGARRLTAADAPVLQALLQASSAYFRAADGRTPDRRAAADLLAEADADEDVDLWGVFEGSGQLALLHLCRPLDAPDAVAVVLLLLHPAQRGRGLGTRVVAALVAAARAAHVPELTLGVQGHNPEAEAFWRAQGFIAERESDGVTDFSLAL
jgi:GNAT superfamily N-acetyltransferase